MSLLDIARAALPAAPCPDRPAPASPLSAFDRAALAGWLDRIGETDPAIRAHVRQQCDTDPAALAFFLAMAAEATPPADPAEDRRACAECARLAVPGRHGFRRCLSAQEVVGRWSYAPEPTLPRRCDAFAPLPALGGAR